MANVKIAYVGAGSYVFGPSVLHDVLVQHRLGDAHLALVDLDGEIVRAMAAAGQRIARDLGLATRITAHTNRDEALDGADFVVCSAAVQMQKRSAMDQQIIQRHCPGHLLTEFGGIMGIAYSLRQIAMIEQLAADIHRLCPKARLLSVANPLPRVCQAAHECGINTVGLCAVSISGYAMLWRAFTGERLPYPYADARARWDATMGGVNHFAFLLGLKDRSTGADAMPALDKLRQGTATTGQSLVDAVWRQTGHMPMAGDDHIQDFLPPAPDAPSRHETWHGTGSERAERLLQWSEIADGRAPWKDIVIGSCWEKPIDIIAAMSTGKEGFAHSLDLINTAGRCMTNLPTNVFAETSCRLTDHGPVPIPVTLPPTVLPLVERTAKVTDTIVRAARQRTRQLVHEAADLDPTILDKPAARRALDDCLSAHADVLPKYV